MIRPALWWWIQELAVALSDSWLLLLSSSAPLLPVCISAFSFFSHLSIAFLCIIASLEIWWTPSVSFWSVQSLHLSLLVFWTRFIQWLQPLPLPVELMQALEVLLMGRFVHWVPSRLQVSRELGLLVVAPSMGVALQAPPHRAHPCSLRVLPNQEALLLDSMLTLPRPLELPLEQHSEVLEQQVCVWIQEVNQKSSFTYFNYWLYCTTQTWSCPLQCLRNAHQALFIDFPEMVLKAQQKPA